MRVYFSPRATRELTSIFLYLDARSKSGARNVMRAIHDSKWYLRNSGFDAGGGFKTPSAIRHP